MSKIFLNISAKSTFQESLVIASKHKFTDSKLLIRSLTTSIHSDCIIHSHRQSFSVFFLPTFFSHSFHCSVPQMQQCLKTHILFFYLRSSGIIEWMNGEECYWMGLAMITLISVIINWCLSIYFDCHRNEFFTFVIVFLLALTRQSEKFNAVVNC